LLLSFILQSLSQHCTSQPQSQCLGTCAWCFSSNECYDKSTHFCCGSSRGTVCLQNKTSCCGGTWSTDSAKCCSFPSYSCCEGYRHTNCCPLNTTCCSQMGYTGQCCDPNTEQCCTTPNRLAYPWCCKKNQKCGADQNSCLN